MSDAVDEKPKIDGAGAEGEDVKPKDKGETITIRVKDQTGEETFFKIKQSTRMEKVRAPFFFTFSPRAPPYSPRPPPQVFTAYASRKGVAMHSLRFLIDGERINPDHTPKMLDLEDQDQIDCMLEQQGGR